MAIYVYDHVGCRVGVFTQLRIVTASTHSTHPHAAGKSCDVGRDVLICLVGRAPEPLQHGLSLVGLQLPQQLVCACVRVCVRVWLRLPQQLARDRAVLFGLQHPLLQQMVCMCVCCIVG